MVVEAEADTQVQVQEKTEVLAAVEAIQVQAVQQLKAIQVEEQVTEIMVVAEHLAVQVGTVEAAAVPAAQVQITKVQAVVLVE